jgi:hypothetical protein
MDTRNSGAAAPGLALPKGGGALSALGETFKVDLSTGGGAFSVPLELPEGRGGLGPTLVLQYSTGAGNGPIGLGWRLGVGDVARKTTAGAPTYDDRDTFVFSGADDLVPIGDGRFRPRVEGLHARIQQAAAPDGRICFVVTTRDGVRHTFGSEPASRLDHPDLPGTTYRWLPSETVEPNGSRVVYGWRHEDGAGTEGQAVEAGHRHHQVYLDHIDYLDYDDAGEPAFLYRVRLDYGDLDDEGEPAGTWPVRPDPFSTWRPGFEVRTLRRCRRVMLQTRPPGAAGYRLIRSWQLDYEPSEPDGVSLLSAVAQVGHRLDPTPDAGEVTEEERHPPLRFGYSPANLDRPRLLTLVAEPGGFLAGDLSSTDVDLVDLTGNGLPDVVDRGGSEPMWWTNRGGGVFTGPRRLTALPLEARRTGIDLLLADFDGSGSAGPEPAGARPDVRAC